MMERTFFRCCRLKWIIYGLVTCGIFYISLFNRYEKKTIRKFNLPNNLTNEQHVNQKFITNHSQSATDYQQACVHPILNLNDPEIMKHYRSIPPVRCETDPDWLTVENGEVFVSKFPRQKYGDVECNITYILRPNDFHISFSPVLHLNSSETLQLKHDFFTCFCKSMDGKHSYENIHAGITRKQNVHDRIYNATSGLGLDILMLGFDSLSHMAYMRKLKKTYDYFTKILNGKILNGYNIVGDGTPQALIPILTGKTELELPRTLKRLPVKKYVDIFPMIWEIFKTNGYVTAFAEDSPQMGTFTYRMNGFLSQPTDHYMRPFHIASQRYFSKFKRLCLGSKRRSEIFLNWIKDFYVMYEHKPKFIFGFHSEISHSDVNLVETGDEDLQNTLKFLHEGGYLNKTLLILMSDHGARFSKVRASLQGKQEERRPFMGFAFPEWFAKKYPAIIENLNTNVDRLSSPFDLYPTFRDILNYSETSDDTKKRGLSLLKEIPKSRTCEDADIGSHWCACLKWYPIGKDDVKVKQAVAALVDHLNNLTNPHRELCSELKLKYIVEATYLLPKTNLLKFKRTNDLDGYRPDLSDTTKIQNIKYQIRIYTTPGNGFFEATLTYEVNDNMFYVNTADISRINKYGNDSKCIEASHEHLRKLCYCKSNLQDK